MRLLFLLTFLANISYGLDIDIEDLKHEIQNDPTNVTPKLLLANQYIKNKNYNLAKSMLNDIFSLEPKNRQALKLQTKLEQNIKPKIELSKEQQYKNILKKEDDVDSAVKLYNLYIKKGQKQKAKDLKMKYWRKSISNPIYMALQKRENEITFQRANRLETVYKKTGNFTDFKEYYFEVNGLGYKDLAFKKLEKFVNLNPTNEDAVLFLANQYYWNGESKKSLRTIQPVIKNTNNLKILTLYANLLYQSGKSAKALKIFNKVVSLGGETTNIRKSINLIKKQGINKRKGNPSSVKYIAEKYYFNKNYSKAAKYYKKYFRKNVSDSITRFHYASSLEKLKKYSQAEREYQRVSNNLDKLHLLSTYRYAKMLMAQKDEIKWQQAYNVLSALLDEIVTQPLTKESEEILKYTQLSLKTVSQPMPHATLHKDIYLTESQSKILNDDAFSKNNIQKQYVSSVKGMMNPNLSSISNDTTLEVTGFISTSSDDNLHNKNYGLTVANQNFSLTTKRSNFKNDTNKTKTDISTLSASYDNGDNLSVSIGLNKLDDSTDVVGKIEYKTSYNNHDLTYGLGYQNGIFINGYPCSVQNDINTLSLSLYDLVLLDNLDKAEFTVVLNKFSDNNINLNSWIEYPLYRKIIDNLENSFYFSGTYEYNSKKDTCYNASNFFDTNQITLKSKYKFSSGYAQATASVGYSLKSAKFIYSYGVMLDFTLNNALNIGIDCRHYQSGYSPDGANECYTSFTHVW